jgi:GNAT superfamily N-acetyltransferase
MTEKDDFLYMPLLAVKPSERGKGIATELVAFADGLGQNIITDASSDVTCHICEKRGWHKTNDDTGCVAILKRLKTK